MIIHRLLRPRTARTFFSVVFLFFTGVASAEVTGFGPVATATGVDGGPNHGWVIDGNFDSMQSGSELYLTLSQGSDFVHQVEKRAVYEFALPAALNQPGVTITQAKLI